MLPLGNTHGVAEAGRGNAEFIGVGTQGRILKEHRFLVSLRSTTICTSRVSSHCRDIESAVSTLTLATHSNGDQLQAQGKGRAPHRHANRFIFFVVSVFQLSVFCCVLVYRFNSSVFEVLFSFFSVSVFPVFQNVANWF